MNKTLVTPTPFALSLSKGCPCFARAVKKGQGFDKLSPSGAGEDMDA